MRKYIASALGALALLLTGSMAMAQAQRSVAAPVDVSPKAPARADLTKNDVDNWLDGFMPYALRTGDIAGAVVVVVKDGQVLTQRGFGYADVKSRRPANPETSLFRPGSIAKLFTWTAVMQQVEAGKIDLDADVNKYLDFRIPPRDGRPVTMRQIMTHTAGFADRNKDLIVTDRSRLTGIGAYLKAWVPDRIHAPGTTPAYSNYATALAGYIVERVSGLPFEAYVEQRIFGPLGMEHSTFRQPVPSGLSAMLATGYSRASGDAGQFEFASGAPAGSLSLTGADMARFMIAHLNQGAGLMRPETARMMHDTAATIIPHVNRMRLGFFETNINGREVLAHLGDTMYFHGAMHLFMDEGVGLYVVMNSSGRAGASTTLRSGLFEDFADRYFPAPAQISGQVSAAMAAEHARMMTGQWQNSRRSDNGFFKVLNLMGQITVETNGKGELVIDILRTPGGSPRKWVEIAPFLWREVDGHERLSAQVEDGRVVRWSSDFFSPFMVFEPVPASRSAVWVLPALYASLAILLLTFLHWPVMAWVRRKSGASLRLAGAARVAYRWVRLAAGLTLAVFAGWMLIVANLRTASDVALWSVQILGAIVFAALAVFAIWNAVLAFRSQRTWASRVGAAFILMGTAMILYVAVTFGLVDMTVLF